MAQPHLIIYLRARFGGFHTHLFETMADAKKIALAGLTSGLGAQGRSS
jgi:hypothetical protein